MGRKGIARRVRIIPSTDIRFQTKVACMAGSIHRHRVAATALLVAAVALSSLALNLGGRARAAGTTWWVASSGDDANPGTQAAPFLTVGKAAAVAQPGDVVAVQPGTYREGVEPANSGAPGAPVTFRSVVPRAATLLGTVPVGSWAPASGATWAAAYTALPGVPPKELLVDGAPLPQASAIPTAAGWWYDQPNHLLYLQTAAGDDPGGHTVEVGRFNYGFHVAGKSDIVIDGFAFDRQNNDGVRIADATRVLVRNVLVTDAAAHGVLFDHTSGCQLLDSEVQGSGSHGVDVHDGTQATVLRVHSHDNGFHGIELAGATGSLISGNTVDHNAVPGDVRNAAGISVDGDLSPTAPVTASGNRVVGNVAHDNEDTGIQLHKGSTGSTVADNLSYHNGDHGFDALTSSDNRLLGNTSVGNYKDGFSVEGDAQRVQLYGNLAVDNGLTVSPPEYDLYVGGPVDSSSATLISDSNLWWNSDTSRKPIDWNGTAFATLADYQAASGRDLHSRAADPRFVAAGDFHLGAGSAAIDPGTSLPAGYPTTDLSGDVRADDPASPNTGQGQLPFFDIGAYEFQPHAAASLRVAAPAVLVYGAKATIVGTLRLAATGGPVVGQEVDLYAHAPYRPYQRVAAARTDAAGQVRFVIAPSTTIRLELVHPDTPAVQATTSAAPVLQVRTAVSARPSAGGLRLGQTLTVTGRVAPNHHGQLVYLQAVVHGTWRNVAAARLSATSAYTLRVRPPTRGTWTYRVLKPADADHAAGWSATFRLAVR